MTLEPRDRTRLPDEWGYDYLKPRFMSPFMLRSLLVALIIPVGAFLVAVLIEVWT